LITVLVVVLPAAEPAYVHAPGPDLVNAFTVPSDPLITPLPNPDNVNPNAPVTPPPNVSVPASEAMIDAAPKVTKPLSVFAPLTFKSAPL
jgi:hypothetical protein